MKHLFNNHPPNFEKLEQRNFIETNKAVSTDFNKILQSNRDVNFLQKLEDKNKALWKNKVEIEETPL